MKIYPRLFHYSVGGVTHREAMKNLIKRFSLLPSAYSPLPENFGL
jgi:hypothetical protein